MPPGAALQLRRKADGSVYLVGEIPEVHAFNARQIGRELEHPYGSAFSVMVVLHTENEGDINYVLTGFGELDPDNPNDDRLNYGTWLVQRVQEKAKGAKRRG